MHYAYVLLSDDQARFYTGYTGDLRKRLREHHRGQVRWTASRQPFGSSTTRPASTRRMLCTGSAF